MLTLRSFQQQDMERLVFILNEPDVVRYLSSKIPTPYTVEDAQWWISTGSQMGIVQAIELNGMLVGCIGADRGEFEYNRSAEIGYWIASDFWRQGIATQALNQFVPHVFDTTDIVRLFASVFSENIASMKVLTKCHFAHEATHKKAIFKDGKFYDDHIYSILKS